MNKYKSNHTILTLPLLCTIMVVGIFMTYVMFQYYSKYNIQYLERIKALDNQLKAILQSKPHREEISAHSTIIWPAIQQYEPGYPKKLYKSLLSLIETWNPDHPDPPPIFHETLPHFNYTDPVEREMAEAYRDAEVPFKIYNIPEFMHTSSLWSDEYLVKAFREHGEQHVEKSKNNHFMFWAMRGRNVKDYVPPTEVVQLKFENWLKEAYIADLNKAPNTTEHLYFMTGSPPRDYGNTFVARDLPLFSTRSNNFFITNVDANKGIQCRFSMRGIIAESHYDSGKNMILMIKGAKRYILTPPHTCKKLALITDVNHPSFRHSVIDWSDLDQARAHDFASVDAIDTIVREGEVLFIPSFWMHYIVSLQYSIQCNSRSGSPTENQGADEISECMGLDMNSMGLRKVKAKNRRERKTKK